ncbi:hypothetical protein AB8Z38_33750 [Bradyrhizobium sp. LLZ17]|uniref:Transposase n=1 Tax=Bradyrhizobium sp. LLZ17 TaxID=3239388 RepID=A0AB39XHT5_9BRAD
MGEVVRFVSKAERERLRLIREARAIYDSVFPPSQSINEQRDEPPLMHGANGANAQHPHNILS